MAVIEFGGDLYKVPNGYITESMFFNPLSEKYPYIVKIGDKLLIQSKVFGADWVTMQNGCSQVGQPYSDVLKADPHTNPTVIAIAIKQKFEFDDDSIISMNGYFDWSSVGSGYGQLSFGIDPVDHKVVFDTELMGPVATRAILHDLVDYMVDNGKSDDWERWERKFD